MLPFGVTIPVTIPQRSEILEGLLNYPVYNENMNELMYTFKNAVKFCHPRSKYSFLA
jgi:hypothetical protein